MQVIKMGDKVKNCVTFNSLRKTISKFFFLLVIFLISFIFPNSFYSQCTTSVVPPTVINGINVTSTDTGSVTTYPVPFTSCGLYTTPDSSIHLGAIGAFSYTMNFSAPVNNLDFVLTATGGGGNEEFNFTTNTGIPTIVDQGSCFSTITGNTILSGSGGVGGGNFTISNALPYTSLTITGPGGLAGSLLAICSASVTVAADITERICTGDSVLIGANYQKDEGTYQDTIFGGSFNGGDSIITTLLIVDTFPVFNLGVDTNLCEGETLILNASTPSTSYLWQDNSSDSIFTVSQQGSYWVEVTNNTCKKSDTINISYDPLILTQLGNDTILCEGETLMLNATTPNSNYLWQDLSSNSTLIVSQQGSYWVEIANNSCIKSDTINVDYYSLINTSLGNDTSICQGEKLILNAFASNANYLWQNNSSDSVFEVSEQGTYWVEVTNNVCEMSSDTITVSIENCHCILYIPNSFSPNFDNKNDKFLPKFDCEVIEYSLSIFNRWGQLVFESDDYNISWDGSFEGKLVPTDVYLWKLRYTDDHGNNTQREGKISLLK